jgi:hypothetical protein
MNKQLPHCKLRIPKIILVARGSFDASAEKKKNTMNENIKFSNSKQEKQFKTVYNFFLIGSWFANYIV